MSGGGNSDVGQRLRDLQTNQAIRRLEVFGELELDELRALQRLAAETFGDGARPDGGLLEFVRGQSAIAIGHYTSPRVPGVPDCKRRRVLLFFGISHAELTAQINLWRAAQ